LADSIKVLRPKLSPKCKVKNVSFLEYEFGEIALQGFSIGGLQTSWRLPSLKALFDIGAHPFEFHASNHLFLSHRHLDHIQGVIPLASTRRLQNQGVLQVYGLPEVLDAAKSLLGGARDTGSGLCDTVWNPLEIGKAVDLTAQYCVVPVKTYHSVPCCGYLVERKSKSLKQEYVGTDGHKLAELRKNGTILEDHKTDPSILFTLDTSVEVFTESSFWTDVPVVVTECTFYCEATKTKAKELEHIHIEALAKVLKERFRGHTVVLTHYSPRYSEAEMLAAIDTYLGDAPFNVVLWLE